MIQFDPAAPNAEIDYLKRFAAEKIYPQELTGYAAQRAAEYMMEHWERVLDDLQGDPSADYRPDLVSDIDELIEVLETFKQKAKQVLPIDVGGLGQVDLSVAEEELVEAVKYGDPALAKRAIERGVDVNQAFSYEWHNNRPLFLAALNGHPDVVKVLLAAGADPNRVNPLERAALHGAIYADNAEVIRTLLEAGASIGAKDVSGRTPMGMALQEGRAVAAMTLMAEMGLSLFDTVNGKTLNAHFAGDRQALAAVELAQRRQRAEEAAETLAAGFADLPEASSGDAPLSTKSKKSCLSL